MHFINSVRMDGKVVELEIIGNEIRMSEFPFQSTLIWNNTIEHLEIVFFKLNTT